MYNIGVFIFSTFWIAFLTWLILRWLGRRKHHVGDIVISKREGMTLFSLELAGNPEDLISEKEVVFKVIVLPVESDRE